MRDVKSGAVVHKTMRPTEKVDLVDVTKRTAQYLYGEGDVYTFMDTETYDQYEVSADQLGDDVKFLMPNIMVDMEFTGDNKIIGIELPSTV
ncbi:elongation factor P, partial [Acinetobacter baumannii]|nr:elongation factor P [Acinetobacter baumannii]